MNVFAALDCWQEQTWRRRHFGLIVTTFVTIFRVLTKQTITGLMEKRIRRFIHNEKNQNDLQRDQRENPAVT